MTAQIATPKELVRSVAEVLGTPEPTVVVHDRNLALAGLRTVGGRGLAAARMTGRDAANLIVAVAASNNVKDSAKTVVGYAALESVHDLRGMPIKRYADLRPRHSITDALTALIDAAAHGETPDKPGGRWNLYVHLRGPQFTAKIEWEFSADNGKKHNSYANYDPSRKSARPESEFSDLVRQSTFTHVTILQIGALIGI
jgi:hypothetical protein